jgi:hypothetical protein
MQQSCFRPSFQGDLYFGVRRSLHIKAVLAAAKGMLMLNRGKARGWRPCAEIILGRKERNFAGL